MTVSATELHAIFARRARESAARMDALERRYAAPPLRWWWKLSLAGSLLVCGAAGGTLGWMFMVVVLRSTACH